MTQGKTRPPRLALESALSAPRVRWAPLGAFAALLAASAFVRTRALDTPYWIDEGISIGFASYGLVDIPGALEQDGSPPLYYLLLALWTQLFGFGEEATHGLSLAFALLAVPTGFWAGRSLFGRRAGWACAVVAALNPFLTIYAQETRMYALAMLLSVVATAAFLHGFVHRDRRYLAVFAVSLAALLYTHNWGLFLAAGALAALAVLLIGAGDRRPLLRDGLLSFGAVGLLYLPWLPSLVYQAEHTGAPWSEAPIPSALSRADAPSALVAAAAVVFCLVGIGGLVRVGRRRGAPERRAAGALLVLLAVTFVVALTAAQLQSTWANRYLAVLAGPILLLAGAGLAGARTPGLLALVAVGGLWLGFRAPEDKSNAASLARAATPGLGRGDLVLVAQPEQVPVLHHYLPSGLRYATPLGSVQDPRIMDWRDAVSRLEGARTNETLPPLLDALPSGGRALLIQPLRSEQGWSGVWKSLVLERSLEWGAALAADGRLRERARLLPPPAGTGRDVRATLYERR